MTYEFKTSTLLTSEDFSLHKFKVLLFLSRDGIFKAAEKPLHCLASAKNTTS